MNLCTYSKSAIFYRDILPTCPLNLNTSEAKHCPCRKREYLPNDLRVLTCTHPNTWNGSPISDPESVKANIRKRIHKLKPGKEPKMSNAIATASPADDDSPRSTALAVNTIYDRVSDPLDFVNKIGATLYNSKMFGCSNIDQGRALAFGFITNKLDPFSWKQRHHIIGGNITMSAEAMLADFRTKTGGTHRIISRTPEKAAVELSIKRDKQIFEFAWEDAINEDYVWTKPAVDDPKKRRLANGSLNTALLKDNYSTPRRRMQMLWARVISDGVGAMAPEVSAGQQTPEELGVLGNDIQGEIIDAEFTVASTVHTVSVNEPSDVNNAAADDVSPPTTTSSGPQAEVAPPAAPTTISSPPEAVEFKTEPSPVAPPAPGALAQQAIEEQRAMLLELKALKTELLTDEQYKAVIAKRGVASAKDMDLGELAKLLDGLRARKAKKAAAEGTDEVSQWANSALQGTTAATPGN